MIVVILAVSASVYVVLSRKRLSPSTNAESVTAVTEPAGVLVVVSEQVHTDAPTIAQVIPATDIVEAVPVREGVAAPSLDFLQYRLDRLQALLDAGTITQAEYDFKRASLIEQL